MNKILPARRAPWMDGLATLACMHVNRPGLKVKIYRRQGRWRLMVLSDDFENERTTVHMLMTVQEFYKEALCATG